MSEEARPRLGPKTVEVFVVLGIVALLVSIVVPAIIKSRQEREAHERNRRETGFMRRFGTACLLYAHDRNGRLPESIEAAGAYMHPDDAPLLRRLVFVAAGRPSDSDGDELIAYMVVNSQRPGGVYALYMDGHSKFLEREEIEALLANEPPGTRPTTNGSRGDANE